MGEPDVDIVIWHQLGSLIEVIYTDWKTIHRRGDQGDAAELRRQPDPASYPLLMEWPVGNVTPVAYASRPRSHDSDKRQSRPEPDGHLKVRRSGYRYLPPCTRRMSRHEGHSHHAATVAG